ncbi:MAG: AraC family transcriptional regulator [Planctomycetota bacterium]|nr:MAG: AraC family transcriptional regulator [Planctomycetota bacterium]
MFQSPVIEVRENHCTRHNVGLSPTTEPMPYHEVVFASRGLWCRHQGARSWPVDSRHVHFFAQGSVHRVSHPAGCGDRNTGLAVSADALEEITRGINPERTPRSPYAHTHRRVDARLAAAHGLLRRVAQQGADALAVEELSLRLVVRALGTSSCRDASSPRPPTASERIQVEQARALLHHDLSGPLSVSDVAAAVGLSAFHLSRVFSRVIGTPMMRYRGELRLADAIQRVLTGDAALADVAASSGFADRSHLTRSVRRALGGSPAALRAALGDARWEALARRWLDVERAESKQVHARARSAG